MESIGGLADLNNLSSCLLKDKDFEVYSKKNQTKDQMISELRKLPISRFCLVYLQGHGIPGLYLPKDTYIENGERQGLTSQEMHDTLLLGGYRRLLLLSDVSNAYQSVLPHLSSHVSSFVTPETITNFNITYASMENRNGRNRLIGRMSVRTNLPLLPRFILRAQVVMSTLKKGT
ncbi:hypothetical protein FRC12_002208 [Ceratobasidium sp. 428]|nr:hypothetical protein FRC12_002208 [Ceratobasidium sp. 428]